MGRHEGEKQTSKPVDPRRQGNPVTTGDTVRPNRPGKHEKPGQGK